MYDELVEALRLCVKYGKGADVLANALKAADAIEELSATAESYKRSMEAWADEAARAQEMMPRWIPVTERLPGREWVLCKCRAKIYEVLSLRDGYWYHDPQHKYMSGFVTHWMPLPSTEGLDET